MILYLYLLSSNFISTLGFSSIKTLPSIARGGVCF